MTRVRALRWGLTLVAVLGLTSLYRHALSTGFLNDDYQFLEEAKTRTLASSLSGLGPLGNYYRPVSRQLYFETLAPLSQDRPIVFHLVNYALFLGALALLGDLLACFLPLPGVVAGLLYFATLPFQRVNLTWISCSQDLLALVFSLAAVAAWRRGRDGWAVAAYLLAVFSKESALPLPLLLALWPGSSAAPSTLGRRLAPFLGVVAIWAALELWMRAHSPVAMRLQFRPDFFLAGWVHEIQALLGLDHPADFFSSFSRHGPAPFAMIGLAGVALLLPPPRPPAGAARPGLPAGTIRWAALWLLAYGFVVGPVASTWSSYYYTLAAVGAAILVGSALRRIDAAGWLLLVAGLLWWHAAGNGIRAFAVADRPWGWTTHLSSFYFDRAAALTDTLQRQLLRLEPQPPRQTRFFFATLPPSAGFQMGNGALVRTLYRDPSLQSYFYSQFSESTAADHPVRFYWYEPQGLVPMFAPKTDVFFQVGSDMLIFGRWTAARHAFVRGLSSGEHAVDLYYWLGWTELWLGHRAAAEAAWSSFGARDDSLRWWIRMRVARTALLVNRDTLMARRELAEAIRSGIGRPEAHAVLGDLLMARYPKYGLLELMIAASLNPYDWVARRGIVQGLLAVNLDDQARAELEALKRIEPNWQRDSIVSGQARTLERRLGPGRDVAQF